MVHGSEVWAGGEIKIILFHVRFIFKGFFAGKIITFLISPYKTSFQLPETKSYYSYSRVASNITSRASTPTFRPLTSSPTNIYSSRPSHTRYPTMTSPNTSTPSGTKHKDITCKVCETTCENLTNFQDHIFRNIPQGSLYTSHSGYSWSFQPIIIKLLIFQSQSWSAYAGRGGHSQGTRERVHTFNMPRVYVYHRSTVV